jgi:glycosyltransferase involved in cell wall biosynthesis
MGEWYARADLFALTSRFEGFPLVLAEAMAYGCPVISYDCDTGPRDIVRDGIDGLLVAPSAGVDGVAKALSRLMSEEDTRLEMSKRAVEARERFSIGRILGYWDGAFEKVIQH